MVSASRRGLWLLPVAGFLTALPWFEFIHVAPGQQHVARDEALRAVSFGDQLAIYAYAAGLLGLLIGSMALCAFIMSTKPGALIQVAFALDVIAASLVLSVQVGVVALARPIAADFYLSGHGEAGSLVLQLSGATFAPRIMAFLLAAVGVAVLGAIGTSVAMWRAGIGRWSGVLVAAGFVLALATAPLVSWVGATLLIAAGGWIAWHADGMRSRASLPDDLRAEVIEELALGHSVR